jgi:selenocysteine-specific elongation factor
MIIGTAGHIDHGKTSLVRALTGIDTDRLEEEKRRGITIELGFAHLKLPSGLEAGVVDVPGHERFVKAMAAGAGGIDLVVLVVAADEGVMPQTREHLDICRLLGIGAGVVAVTKADLLGELGPDWMELLRADLKELTAGTFLEGAEVVPVSAKDGQGLDALVGAIDRAAATLPSRSPEGPVFLPVDRAFSIKGFGTVVTGTLLSGTLSVEESAALLPGMPGPLRVRGIQVHGKQVERAVAGERTAINLAGVEADAISRGMVLCRHDELPATRMLDVELELLPAAEAPLRRRQKLRVHLGTAQADATVALLGDAELRPGERALAQLRLGEELAALPGQRFILRGSKSLPGRGATVAGGRILAIASRRRRKGAAELLRPLAEGSLEDRLRFALRQAGYGGLTARDLYARTAAPPKQLARALELLGSRGQVLLVDKERRLYLSAEVFEGLTARALSLLEAHHQREPLKEGLGKEELRQRLSPELEPRILARLVQSLLDSGRVEAHAELLRLPGRGAALTAQQSGARERLLEALATAALAPPRVDELALAAALPRPRTVELLKLLASLGQVVRVSEELYFHAPALDQLRARLVAHLTEHKEISTQAFKDLVGQSRKYVIPLSEYFDREKVTLRVGEKRILRRG